MTRSYYYNERLGIKGITFEVFAVSRVNSLMCRRMQFGSGEFLPVVDHGGVKSD